MTNVQKQNYGYQIKFAGSVSTDEMSAWVEESKRVLNNASNNFGVMVDMREMSPLSQSAKEQLELGQSLFKEKGMKRSAVIVNQGFTATQLKLVAQKSGIHEWEKYIDASSHQDWEDRAINWLSNGVSPY